jgi:hypothetical protein
MDYVAAKFVPANHSWSGSHRGPDDTRTLDGVVNFEIRATRCRAKILKRFISVMRYSFGNCRSPKSTNLPTDKRAAEGHEYIQTLQKEIDTPTDGNRRLDGGSKEFN